MTQPVNPQAAEVPWNDITPVSNPTAHPPQGDSGQADAVVAQIPAPDGEVNKKAEETPKEAVVEDPSMVLRLNPAVVRVLRDAFTKVGDGVPVTIIME